MSKSDNILTRINRKKNKRCENCAWGTVPVGAGKNAEIAFCWKRLIFINITRSCRGWVPLTERESEAKISALHEHVNQLYRSSRN